MKFWAGATFFVFFIFAAVIGAGSVSSGAKFDFEAATPEERLEWMEEVNRGVVNGAKKTLPDGRGIAPKMTISSSVVNVNARSITTTVQIHGPSQSTMSQSAAQAELNRKACPDFVKGPLLSNRIRLFMVMKDQSGRTVVRLETSPRTCAGYAQQARK